MVLRNCETRLSLLWDVAEWALTALPLARSGVSKIRLVDFDQVTLSSLNRHAVATVATLADMGTSKVHCVQRRFIAIAPWVKFDLRQEKFDGSVAKRILIPGE
ncbi:hypothetical protein E4U22_003130, partial [Claviceps purpurea]